MHESLPDLGLCLLGGSKDFKKYFPEKVIMKQTAEMMSWNGGIPEEICGFSASWYSINGWPWVRETIRMVVWNPGTLGRHAI